MEPISIIVGALVAGASTALKETANQSVKDAYQGLKSLVIQHWKSRIETSDQTKENEAKEFLVNLENDPAGFQNSLKSKLNEIMPQPEVVLIDQAKQLEQLLNKLGYDTEQYNVSIGNDNKGIQIGNDNTQNNTFN